MCSCFFGDEHQNLAFHKVKEIPPDFDVSIVKGTKRAHAKDFIGEMIKEAI